MIAGSDVLRNANRKATFRKSHDQALIYSILNEEPKSLISLRADVEKQSEQVIQKALEKDRGKRCQSMKEFIQELNQPPPRTFPKTDKSIVVLSFGNLSLELENWVRWDERFSWVMAAGYALIGRKPEASDWLENAVNRGFINCPFLNEYDPLL